MHEYRPRYAWAFGLVALVLIAVAAGVAYNIGLSQGLAQAGVEAAAPRAADWHRPWGMGFLFPLMFFGFWLLLIFRGVYWGWGPWGWHRYYGGPRFSDSFDEWHRRAHERMDTRTGPTAPSANP